MRAIVTTIIIVTGLLWIAATIAGDRDGRTGTPGRLSPDAASSRWRRTAQGWEPAAIVVSQQSAADPARIHPLLVASWQLLVSLFALVAAPSTKPQRAAGDERSEAEQSVATHAAHADMNGSSRKNAHAARCSVGPPLSSRPIC